MSSTDRFPTEVSGLPESQPVETRELADGGRFDLRIAPVAMRIGPATVRMLAYNGSIPGPTLVVRQGSRLTVDVANDGDLETTVHWHGLRLDNRYDGTSATQSPICTGEKFSYQLVFPDPGIFWYHPHIREDFSQEVGLYGNIVVVPSAPDYWPPVHREIALALDDILIEDGQVAPFNRSGPTYSAMGRFGNHMLVNGQTDYVLSVRQGEVVRFYLTNTANTRVFNVGVSGAQVKRVGSDAGHFEREEFVQHTTIAPSERAVLDVLFDGTGPFKLEHRTPRGARVLAVIHAEKERAQPHLAAEFGRLRVNSDMRAARELASQYLHKQPDKTLALVAEMNLDSPGQPGEPVTYGCPMHLEVKSDRPGKCPKCGMKLLAVTLAHAEYSCPMHPEVKSSQPGKCPKCGMKLLPVGVAGLHADHGGHQQSGHGEEHAIRHGHDGEHGHVSPHKHDHQDQGVVPVEAPAGIEWEDDMVEVNRLTNPTNTRWKLIDRATGGEGAAIDWRFRVGDRVKIRLLNELDSDHPMQHPIHIHGAGRFLILARGGVAESNLVWKDTVLVATGQTVDILLEVTNPGTWMVHCHIAEHHESGMMFRFTVQS